ncbi:MAG TPA: hypothetical protein VN259_17265 [Xanthomonadales bacterium]|nr:hypothetical protein [Xanthomonadales bacterium]
MSTTTLKLHREGSRPGSVVARLVMPGDGFGHWDAQAAQWSDRLEEGDEPLLEYYSESPPQAGVARTPFGYRIGDREAVQDARKRLHSRQLDLDRFSRDLTAMWLDSHPMLPACPKESDVRASRIRASAEKTVKGFEYECIARSQRGTDEIWRCRNPNDENFAHDLVISRYGISAFGDMDPLTFNVGSSYGLKFLAGSSVEGYIYSKLDQAHRAKLEIDPGQVDELLGNALLMIVDHYWFENPEFRDQGGPRFTKAVHDADKALRAECSRANLSRLIVALAVDEVGGCEKLDESKLPRQIAIDFSQMVNDVRAQPDERGVVDCLEYWESDFDVPFRELIDEDTRLMRPSTSVLVRLHVLNIGAQRILEQKRQQESAPGESTAERVVQRVAHIESEIEGLRGMLGGADPVLIRLSPNVDIELGSLADYDERVWVGRHGWGGTCVNYTAEGLIVDVLPQDDIDAVHTLSIPRDELESDDDETLTPAARSRAG